MLDLIAEQAVKLKTLPPTDALKASEREHFIPEIGTHSRASVYAAEQELALKRQASAARELKKSSGSVSRLNRR